MNSSAVLVSINCFLCLSATKLNKDVENETNLI